MTWTEPAAVASRMTNTELYTPCSLTTNWTTIITAGNITADTNAGTLSTSPGAGKLVLSREHRWGTHLLVRLKYPVGATVSGATAPVLTFYGRTNNGAGAEKTDGDPMRLFDRSGSSTITLTPTANDVSDGAWKYTDVVVPTNTIDCAGCDEIIAAVITGLAGTGFTNSIVQAKFI